MNSIEISLSNKATNSECYIEHSNINPEDGATEKIEFQNHYLLINYELFFTLIHIIRITFLK